MSIIDSINTLVTQQRSLLSKFSSSEWVTNLETTISEIKTKVNTAISVNDVLNKTIYVSTSAGIDTNSGTSRTSPLKTIKAAIDLIPINGSADIILLVDDNATKSGQTFNIDSDITIKNQTIVIKNEVGMANKNTIQFMHDSAYSSFKVILKSNTNLSFEDVIIKTSTLTPSELASLGVSKSESNSSFKLEDDVFGAVRFKACQIFINDYNLFSSTTYSDISISLINSNLKQNKDLSYYAYIQGGFFKFSVVGTTNSIKNYSDADVNLSTLIKDIHPNNSFITYIPSTIL